MKNKIILAIFLLLACPIATATITFNDWVTNVGTASSYSDRLYIAKYYISNGTTTGYYTKPTSLDIFTDTAQAGDMIAFAWNRGVWKNLNVSIDTAITATAIGIDWYWRDVYGNYKPINVTSDPSNNFTTTGKHVIEFEVPNCWTLYYNYGGAEGDGYWIVANLSTASGVTEGGHIDAEVDGGSYAINFYDGTYTPDDLHDASTAGNWNMTQQIYSYTHLESNLIMGKSGYTTNLNIDDGEIFEIGIPSYDYQDECLDSFYGKRTFMAEFTGDKLTIGKNTTNTFLESSMLKYNGHYYGVARYNYMQANMDLFASLLYRANTGFNDMGMYGNTFNMINSIISGSGTAQPPYIVSNSKGTINNVVVAIPSSTVSWYIYSANALISNIMFSNGKGTIVGSTTNISNIDYGTDKIFGVANANVKAGCINCKFTDMPTQIVPASSGDEATIYYTMDINVYDTSYNQLSFNLTVTDALGSQKYKGNYSAWTNKNIPVYYENNAGTSISYNPYTIEIDVPEYAYHYTTFNVTDITRYMTLTATDYFNGTIVVSHNKIKIFR